MREPIKLADIARAVWSDTGSIRKWKNEPLVAVDWDRPLIGMTLWRFGAWPDKAGTKLGQRYMSVDLNPLPFVVLRLIWYSKSAENRRIRDAERKKNRQPR